MEQEPKIFYSEPMDYEVVERKGEKEYYTYGYISTSDKDLVNDIVTKECLDDMLEQMSERVIKLDIEHESFRGETDTEREINKTRIPIAKFVDAKKDENGLFTRAVLNKAHPRFKETWESIKGGFLDAYSIAFVVPENGAYVDGDTRYLKKINLLNVAYTGNPVNPEAKMGKVFAKSLDCYSQRGGNMENKDEPQQPQPEQEQPETQPEQPQETEEPKNPQEEKVPEPTETDENVVDTTENETEEPEGVDTRGLLEEIKSLRNEINEIKNKLETKDEEKEEKEEEKPKEQKAKAKPVYKAVQQDMKEAEKIEVKGGILDLIK